MQKVILICNAGMSSSLMAKKVTEYIKDKDLKIIVEATTSANSEYVFDNQEYEMILVSPQIRMKFDEYSKKAEKNNKKIAQVTFDAYSPTPLGIEKMAELIISSLNK